MCIRDRFYGADIRYCSNRKEVKDHGDTGILLGSPLQDQDKVVIIEAVSYTHLWMIGGVEPDFRTIADFPGKNAPEDVPVGASVWNDKKSDGSQPLSVKRIAEGGRRICALLSGI